MQGHYIYSTPQTNPAYDKLILDARRLAEKCIRDAAKHGVEIKDHFNKE